MEFVYFLKGTFLSTPQTIVWIMALVLSIVLLKRSSSRPARFLVIGSSLILVGTLIVGAVGPFINYAEHHGLYVSHHSVLRFSGWFSLLTVVPGTIYLIYAIWKKFTE